jgi:glutaconate CoA-transferase, subunit A
MSLRGERKVRTIGVTDPSGRNKIMSAREAVAEYIHAGTCVAIGGFGYTRLPMTLVREIIRQNVSDLFVTTCGAAAAMECLAASGLISRLDTTYIGLEGLQPVANSLRRQIEDGDIEIIEEYDNCSYSARALAGRYGWPFAPVMTGLGSDLMETDVLLGAGFPQRPEDGRCVHDSIPPQHHHVIDDPFNGWGLRPHEFRDGDTTGNETNALPEVRLSTRYTNRPGVKVVLVPPLIPEVAIIRAAVVGDEGTVRLEGGIWGADNEIGIAARILIVECEKIVPEADLRYAPEANTIAAHCVDVIVEQPFGGYPAAVPGYYDYDWDFWTSYSQLNRRNKEEVKRWWHSYVADTEDDWHFLATRAGRENTSGHGSIGWERLFELRADATYGYRPQLSRPLPRA